VDRVKIRCDSAAIADRHCANESCGEIVHDPEEGESVMPEQIFRVKAQGDTIYIGAFCREDAEKVFRRFVGDDFPASLASWKVVTSVPEDEEVLR
jgi:hypothetical protein